MKSLSQHINESFEVNEETHYFGASYADEQTAARAADSHASGYGQTWPWKNSQGLQRELKTYYIQPALMSQLSTSRVTMQLNNEQLVTFVAKDGFDENNVRALLNDPLKRFNKSQNAKSNLRNFTSTSFQLEFVKSYAVFTDTRGHELRPQPEQPK